MQTFFWAYRESREKGFDNVESLGREKGKPVSRKVPLPPPILSLFHPHLIRLLRVGEIDNGVLGVAEEDVLNALDLADFRIIEPVGKFP